MKKLLVALVVMLFCAGTAYALPVTFDSLLTFSNVNIGGGVGVLYSHDITLASAGGFVPATNTLSSAMLDIDLVGSNNSSRHVGVVLDGNPSGSYLFSDPTWETLIVNISWLQSDGVLNVDLTRDSGNGTAKLMSSELTAIGDRSGAPAGDPPAGAPVPEPASMMLLGMGILGLVSFKRKA